MHFVTFLRFLWFFLLWYFFTFLDFLRFLHFWYFSYPLLFTCFLIHIKIVFGSYRNKFNVLLNRNLIKSYTFCAFWYFFTFLVFFYLHYITKLHELSKKYPLTNFEFQTIGIIRLNTNPQSKIQLYSFRRLWIDCVITLQFCLTFHISS